MRPLRSFKRWYKGLPESKKYIEVLTAIISIPVLLTVLLNNLGNLQERKDRDKNVVSTKDQVVTIIPIEIEKEVTVQPTTPVEISASPTTPPQSCKREVGPSEILSPQKGEVVTEDPVCIDISYETGEYCAVVWSYRINGGKWSDFTDKAICLLNLNSGEKNLQVRVKSIASGDEKILESTFTYQGKSSTPTPTSAPSPTPNSN